MEEYKLLYLQRFLGRKSEIDVETWITLLGNFEDEALKCYDGLGNHNSRRFLEMLLLDGCFVVEFIRECCHIEPRDANDQIINAEWMMNQVCRDMLLLENQLPFFILTKLHDMTNHKHPTENFFYMVKSTFSDLFPKKMTYRSEIEDEKFDHLLHVVHRLCSPSKKKIPTTNGSKQSDQCCKISFCGNTLQISKDIPSFSFWESFQIPSVTELHQAGVSFSKLGNLEEDSTTLFDIKFNRGLMEAPCFVATNTFEIFMRNLIAYEQHSSKIFPKYFSHYALLMTQLINSRKDVSLLREKEIILNGLGSDEEVASIFNKLAIGVHLVPSDFSYAEECSNMIQHCKIPWNQMKANLRHNYFNSPWVGASTVAAIILLILTVVQTVLAFIGEVKK
ncbi:UPF0481 protein At3g47200-like [Lycium barbarum]|uniref:UPF0481 protein At3g47200-like n=1 Tax=Lycium barbarum TaxID=112863 RepID=UPI00293F08A0|nr:UPF0481 protein At3g47200-like [Lycium barbarum]